MSKLAHLSGSEIRMALISPTVWILRYRRTHYFIIIMLGVFAFEHGHECACVRACV